MIIGLGYKADTGKDTIAEYLVARHGFVRVAYADVLRGCAQAVFGWTHHQLTDRVEKESLDSFWEMTRRQGVQRLGDALRREFGNDVIARSVKAALARHPNVVVSDVRKRVECEQILGLGGRLWRVDRAQAQTVAAHGTETELDGYGGWHQVIGNNGTLEELYARVDVCLAMINMQRVVYSDKDIVHVINDKENQ